MSGFASAIIDWQKRHGRRGLPWQGTRDPYRVWLSEVMLQQTQVATVIPYYERFLQRFPTVQVLASASEDEVLRLWSGLGYYARGRNLHAAAKTIAADGFPRSSREIEALPGLGRSTAAAIAAFAFGERAAILDGNVKRVLARYFGIEGWPVEDRLWERAQRLLPKKGIETYTQALMDLGATVCIRTPKCEACPVKRGCVARREGRTDAIPAPRPRKPLPTRSVTWLVLRHGAQVLLEKRPGAGLWGGLWSFPEGGPRQLEYDILATRELEPLVHGFTHFRLRIRPLLCELRKAPPLAESPGRLWLGVADALEAAVPAPVRKVLRCLVR